MKTDYKTIDAIKESAKKDENKKIKRRLKIAVSSVIFLPLVYFIFINFVLGLHVPEQMYAILGILYIAIFIIIIVMSLIIPHS